MDNKQRLLVDRMRALRSALQDAALEDPLVQSVLNYYTPLFNEIEAGKIIPPWGGRYRSPIFSKDSAIEVKYGADSMLSRADADFMSALEDWPSQAWFQRISNPTDSASHMTRHGPDTSPLLRHFWHLKDFLRSWWHT